MVWGGGFGFSELTSPQSPTLRPTGSCLTTIPRPQTSWRCGGGTR